MNNIVILISFFLLFSNVYSLEKDPLSASLDRFKTNNDFHATVILDQYLKSNSDLDAEFWRVWGEFKISDLESAEEHLSSIEEYLVDLSITNPSSSIYFYKNRLELFKIYLRHLQIQEPNLNPKKIYQLKKLNIKIYAEIKKSQEIFNEDLNLFNYLGNLIKPSWNSSRNILFNYEFGYDNNPNSILNIDTSYNGMGYYNVRNNFSWTPWVNSLAWQPFLSIDAKQKNFFPDAPEDLSATTFTTKLGTSIDVKSVSTRITGIWTVLLQNDSLYKGYPIYQERQALEFDISLAQTIGLIASIGQRLFREKALSRNEYEINSYINFPIRKNIYFSLLGGYGNYFANDSWNDFNSGLAIASINWKLMEKVIFRSSFIYEFKEYEYDKLSIPRTDISFQAAPSLNLNISDRLKAEIKYTYSYKKINHYKSSKDTFQEENLLQKSHILSLNFVWKYSWENILQTRQISEKTPWVIQQHNLDITNINSDISQIRDNLDSRESQRQSSSCRE